MSSAFIENSHNLLNSNNIINEEEEQEQLSSQFVRKCSTIDIHGKSVSHDILVALLDRPVEMKQLALRNAQFYEAIENYITETQGNFAWQKFQDIIYKPREKLPDRVWINQISQYLGHNPVFLSKFKETVGYEDDEENYVPIATAAQPPPPPHKLTSSTSTGSMNTLGSNGRRRSRRLSTMSLGDVLADDDDSIIEEEPPKVPDGMFTNEDMFYQGGRRRRASYHSIQSEPHPTFVESKIDEVDEAEIEVEGRDEDTKNNGDDSDHLGDLLDDDSSSDEEDTQDDKRAKDIGAGYSCRQQKGRSDMDLIKLRDYPQFQANLPHTHSKFFRKAKQLLSLAPSSRHFSATIRRNSILEDAMPPSPVTELDEPRFQTCSEVDEEDKDGNLEHLICCTRRQQPDDIAWLNGVMESLAGWPELVDRLHDIINETTE